MPHLEVESELPGCTGVATNAFEKLVQDLSAALGPSSGLDSSDVDPMKIQLLMEKYTSNSKEWSSFALGDASRPYTRNLIDEGNGKSNLLILVWSPGKGSTIHDHANSHCVMKILKGHLQEDLYSWPDQKQLDEDVKLPLQLIKRSTYGENKVTYMSDELGLHRMSNPASDEFAISLHLYTPPNAANNGFCIYDERNGKASRIPQTNYYSIRGQRLNDEE